MPVEAELLCDYFLSSKLSSKKKSSDPISATAILLKKQKLAKANNLSTSSFTTNEQNFDTIEFVKYEKNPMDYLKSKYTLLNGSTAFNETSSPLQKTLKLTAVPEKSQAPLTEEVITQKKKNMETTLYMNWSKLKRNGIGLLNIGKYL